MIKSKPLVTYRLKSVKYHFVCHIQSNDLAPLSHQFAEDEAVSARSTAQIKHFTSFQLLWNHQTAAKIPADLYNYIFIFINQCCSVMLYLLQTSGWTCLRASHALLARSLEGRTHAALVCKSSEVSSREP